AILGLNEYKSAVDVYYENIGAKNEKVLTDKARVTMEIGNRLEDLDAEMFQERHPSIQVINDKTMYQHEKYPFMLANTDRILILPDGMKAIMECKTVTYADEWENTDFCKGIKGKCPLSYEYQGRHYMATLDIDLAVIVGLDLIRKELYIVYISRDMEVEEQMIAAEAEFWQLVERREFLSMKRQFEKLSIAIKANAFKRFYGAGKDVVYQVNNPDEIEIFNEMNDLIVKQQFHSAESQKAKEAKEELAMELFLLCEARLNKKPGRIELNNASESFITKQYITLTDTTAVNFDLQRFILAYNIAFKSQLPEDIDESTAILMCSQVMSDRMGEFLTVGDKSARFIFPNAKSECVRI
ncbi:MAG: YqaJ viral recombinase family protein, partial [Anaerotignum sp.]|nr:YqaJ viral recombinase family protein [Anaerotignum sp.]